MHKLKVEQFLLPAHWASALINDDASGLDDDDAAALDQFADDMVKTYGRCWPLTCDDDLQFMTYHDARPFGVLACDVVTFHFDVTPR